MSAFHILQKIPKHLQRFISKSSLYNASRISTVLPSRRVNHPINLGSYSTKANHNYGICFDIEGVLVKGGIPLQEAKAAMKLLCKSDGHFKVPVAFVTNSLSKNEDRAAQLSEWFDIKVFPSQMVPAQGPLQVFSEYHNKHCLFIGQGKLREIAQEVGFNNISTIDDIINAYPLLDVVDHGKRKSLTDSRTNFKFPPVDAVISLGEPLHWETVLQLVVDLLITGGKPDVYREAITPHIPLIACNQDLHIMHRAPLPRFSHGAFLLCLEALYQKVSGHVLHYTGLLGKPSEITFRYAEHRLQLESERLGLSGVQALYMIGDNPASDIVGPNLYKQHLERLKSSPGGSTDDLLPKSRRIPPDSHLTPQRVQQVSSLLVCTGVYQEREEIMTMVGNEVLPHAHRDYTVKKELTQPTAVVNTVLDAVQYVLENENANIK